MDGRRIVLATGNAGKAREIGAMLAPAGIDIISQAEFGLESADETAVTFVENALLKARHAAAGSGLAAIADDSGLVVDALGGAPGVHSARYAGDGGDAANIRKLLAELRDVPAARRGARFICVAVLLRHPEDPLPLVCEGRWEGVIAPAPRGEAGFGYDPVFLPRGETRSAAELPAAEKNRLSHRGHAFKALLARLRDAAGDGGLLSGGAP
ncbi:MAG: RdgB/HAM1 family non-canonical purine NTP pyrophosphatase [Gammaproteobacteria bacterium]